METNFLFYLSTAIVVTSLLWYVYVIKIKSKYENLNSNLDREVIVKSGDNVKNLEETINNLKANASEIKHKSFQEGYEKARSEFSITVFPFTDEYKSGDDGFLINDIYHEVYVGYKYQLFMNGIPILEPATITLEKLVESKREVDFVKVERAINLVESKLMPMISESKGIMKLVKS